MQATLDAFALKPFIKALQCLSKYGDELVLYATPQNLSLSATNSSLSAYCRFRYDSQFFVRYNVGNKGKARQTDVEEVENVTGQLMTKSLLSILKHRTVEKSVDRCELLVTEGSSNSADGDDNDDEEPDSLESKLIVRLHCKHGVIKTHRLLLLTPNSLMAPSVPPADNESHLTIGARTVKDIIDHFPSGRLGGGSSSNKADPQLVWTFDHIDVSVKTLDMSVDAKGNAQLATELTLSADEFDVYTVPNPPITISFHLREFNATITFADSLALPLSFHFTDPAAPLFIDIDGGSDAYEVLFVISTIQVSASARSTAAQNRAKLGLNGNGGAAGREKPNKRGRENDDDGTGTGAGNGGQDRAPWRGSSEMESGSSGRATSIARTTPGPGVAPRTRPQRAVQRTDPATHARAMAAGSRPQTQQSAHARSQMPPPSSHARSGTQSGWEVARGGSMAPPPLPASSQDPDQDQDQDLQYLSQAGPSSPQPQRPAREPLFLPSSQPQLSQAQEAGMREIAAMTDAELWAVLEDDRDFDVDAPDAEVPSSQRNEREVLSVRRLAGVDIRDLDELGREEDDDVEMEMEPTPGQGSMGNGFRPLFED